jgi:hypothetical protein
MCGVKVHHPRRNGISLDGPVDRRKDNDFFGDMNDDAPTGKVGNDFIFLLCLGGSVKSEDAENTAHEKKSVSPDQTRTKV